MRGDLTIFSLGAVVLLILTPFSCRAAPLSQIIQYHLATRTFSELYSSIDAGQYDMVGRDDLARAIFESDSGISDLEREALAERLLIRTIDTSAEAGARGLATELLNWFETIDAPTLRARVLLVAHDYQVDGVSAAVVASAHRLALMLSGPGNTAPVQGYEVEAIAMASMAPAYPSTVLAELLRTIGRYSSDRRVVTACRDAAREIMATE